MVHASALLSGGQGGQGGMAEVLAAVEALLRDAR
jgi:hypothetical protein